MNNVKDAFFTLILTLTLTSCGGGGGSTDGAADQVNEDGKGTVSSTEISGKVIDGYIRGATVCLDLNKNYQCDLSEPSALSLDGGSYSFIYDGAIPDDVYILADITTDAVDEELGPIQQAYNMLAPAKNAKVVTPLTTLVSQEIVNSGSQISTVEAEDSVRNSLGLDESVSLLDNDFIENKNTQLQSFAQTVAEALAVTKAVLASNGTASSELAPAEITKAAINTVKNEILSQIIVNGEPIDPSEVSNQIESTVTDKIESIVASAKSGDDNNGDTGGYSGGGDGNSDPIANAGLDLTLAAGSHVVLDGGGSADTDGDSLTYSWSFISTPVGSLAILSDSTSVTPYFVSDLVGEYVLSLTVNDGDSDSVADEVVVTVATSIEGIISSDTTWDISGSPYMINGLVQVAYGSTLTIDPGVEVQGGQLDVFGTLSAQGSVDAFIVFSDVNVSVGNNTSAEPASIEIRFAEFQGGSLLAPSGGAGYGSLQLRDSTLTETDYMYLWYPTSSVYIERNIFIKAGGISIGTHAGTDVYIRNNFFQEQVSGFAVTNWASYGGSNTVVENNSFVSTDRLALQLPAGYDNAAMTAYNNYWGTVDESVIEQMIFDKNDNLSSNDYIPYQPYLSDHHEGTPIPAELP